MRARAQGRGDGNRRVLAHHGRTSCPRGRYLSHRRCPRKVCRPWRNGLAPATAHDDDAFPHPARYGQRGGNTFTVGGARSTPAQCDRQRCPRGPSAASSAPCRLGGALRRGGAAGGAARPRIAPRGPGTAAGSAVTAGTSPAGRGSERGVGAAPGDSARRQPRSPAPQEQPGAVRRSLPGGWGQQRPGRRTASPRTSRVSPPAPPTSHLPVSPSLRVTPRCHPAPSVSPPPRVTRRAAAAPCRAGGRRGAPARRDTGGHGRTEGRRDGGTDGRGLPAPHRWGRGAEAGGGRRSAPPPRGTCQVPAVASLSGAKQTLPAPGAALCPQHRPSPPPPPGSQAAGTPQTDPRYSAAPGALRWWGQVYVGGGAQPCPCLGAPKNSPAHSGARWGSLHVGSPHVGITVLAVAGCVCVWGGGGVSRGAVIFH